MFATLCLVSLLSVVGGSGHVTEDGVMATILKEIDTLKLKVADLEGKLSKSEEVNRQLGKSHTEILQRKSRQ